MPPWHSISKQWMQIRHTNSKLLMAPTTWKKSKRTTRESMMCNTSSSRMLLMEQVTRMKTKTGRGKHLLMGNFKKNELIPKGILVRGSVLRRSDDVRSSAAPNASGGRSDATETILVAHVHDEAIKISVGGHYLTQCECRSLILPNDSTVNNRVALRFHQCHWR